MSGDSAPWRKQSQQMSGAGATGPPPGVPPPPPPYAAGTIPSVRIPSEISNRKEPPAAIQNAMMTKDKKPFTYTPGGLDLAEIRSPRMAKRISRNAHIEDRYDQANNGVPQYQQPAPVIQQSMFNQQLPQPPRGWNHTQGPVQSRSFRVLQKITDINQEDEPYREMMSPPVYTMPPNYSPNFYKMRSPTYDNHHAGQEGGVGENYWVWDANSQTYVPNPYPPNISCNTSSPAPGSNSGWQWTGNGSSQIPKNQGDVYPPNNEYWNYPPQTEEEQRQFWEHYGQMCAYLAQLNAAACRYSPYPCPPLPYPSDSDECGYSSNDEMTYYGQMFKQRAQNYNQNNRPLSSPGNSNSTPKIIVESFESKQEDSDSTDTETDNIEKEEIQNNSDGSDISDDESSRGGTEIPHQLSVIYEEVEPQLETEGKSSVHPSDDEDSSATLENGSRKASADNTSSDTESSVVRVRLPLKLKFSQPNDEEQVTTVIVGDSEVESSPDVRSEDIWSPTPDKDYVSSSQNSWCLSQNEQKESSPSPEVTVTINLNRTKILSPIENPEKQLPTAELKKQEEIVTSDSPVDFWKELKVLEEDASKAQDRKEQDESPQTWDNSSSETSIQTVKRCSESDQTSDDGESESESSDLDTDNYKRQDRGTANENNNTDGLDIVIKVHHPKRSEDTSDGQSENDSDSFEENEEESKCSESSPNPFKSESIRRNMDLLMFKESIDNDKSREGDESENDDSSDSDSSCANLSLALDLQTDGRGEENFNERAIAESEEDDSGVTSDLSRHISETDTDPECASELSKMTRYQRAATHSRLFKLLQDECNDTEDSDEYNAVPKRERLTLPLVTNASKSNLSSDQESSSSGINSPMSPAVNDRLIKELVQSLLSKKKGRHFRKLPVEKLYAAAARILQEDMDYDTGSTSDDSNMFLSPCDDPRLRPGEQPPGFQLPNPEYYGENYYNYCDYYSSWADAAYYTTQPSYDILPSKTFRTLREKTESDRNRRDFSVPVRCPKLSLPQRIAKEPKDDTAPSET